MNQNSPGIPIAPSLSGIKQRSAHMPGGVNVRVLYLTVQAVLNAVIIGFIAKGLVYLIGLITNVSFYGVFSFKSVNPANNNLGIWVIAVPVIGSILVGIIARYGSKAVRGHGIPEAMEKIILDDSRIPPVITLLKPLSAAISIGTGGPFGAEGPIIATGGAFGSFTGQIMHISATERKIILSAGACAGMSAIFGSPLAAVLLAIELLLFEFSARSIIPVAVACITGAGMHILLFGHEPVFAMGAILPPTNEALLIYIAMGLFLGLVASLVSRSVYLVEDLFELLPFHWMWWPAIGGIAVGITGYFAPITMGVGYENIEHLLAGNLPLATLLTLCFLKFFSWVIALGSGTSGGTLAPLFTIGGAAGALIGLVIIPIFPGAGITMATAALVGMAAMFAGASRAVLTAIVFALETTGQANGLLPLMAGCISAYTISFFMMKGSIMTEKIRRRGIHTPDSYESDLLTHAIVAKIMVPRSDNKATGPSISKAQNLSVCLQVMGQQELESLRVTDDVTAESVGVIFLNDIVKYYSKQKSAQAIPDAPVKTKRMMVRARRLLDHKRPR